MRNIKAICFDLDDTLWDMRPVILNAERSLYEWFSVHFPRVAERYSAADIRDLRMSAATRWPDLAHDLTELRLRVLREIAASTGYGEDMVAGAFEVFFAARNDVDVYGDVEPALVSLGEAFSLFALSNGNADLQQIGLARLFDGIYTARIMGVAKPDQRFFTEAARRAGYAPDQMLHVGDNPLNDIVVARESGMTPVWLNRSGSDWPLDDAEPEYQIDDLRALVELLA